MLFARYDAHSGRIPAGSHSGAAAKKKLSGDRHLICFGGCPQGHEAEARDSGDDNDRKLRIKDTLERLEQKVEEVEGVTYICANLFRLLREHHNLSLSGAAIATPN